MIIKKRKYYIGKISSKFMIPRWWVRTPYGHTLCVLSLNKAHYFNYAPLNLGVQIGIGLGWEGNRLVVMQRSGNPPTTTLLIAQLQMDTSGCTEKCPHPNVTQIYLMCTIL